MGALSFFFITLQHIPLASATTIQYLSPIFTVTIAALIFKESIYSIQWVFFLLSLSGIFLLKGFDQRVETYYLICGIMSAVCSGFAYNFIKQLKNSDHPIVVVFYFPLVATPIMSVLTYLNWVMPVGVEWLYLLIIGILTQVAQVNMTKAYQTGQLSVIASLKYLGVLFALAFGYYFFEETYAFESFFGIVLVISGVLLNVYFKNTLDKKESAS